MQVFFVCHAARITLDVYEFSNLDRILGCPRPGWRPAPWAMALLPVSHFLMVLNSSTNFFIYCLVGHTFRRELCRTLGMGGASFVRGGSGSTGAALTLASSGEKVDDTKRLDTSLRAPYSPSDLSRRPSKQRFLSDSRNGSAATVGNGQGGGRGGRRHQDSSLGMTSSSSSNARISSYNLAKQRNGELERLQENRHGIAECKD